MCGRYYVDDDTAREIEKIVRDLDKKLLAEGKRDIHPSEEALVINPGKDKLSAEIMRWGFPGYQGKGLQSMPEQKLFWKDLRSKTV